MFAFIVSNIFAQNKTTETIEKTGEALEKTGKVLESIFRKKNKTNEDKDGTINQPTSNQKSNETEQTNRTNKTNQLKAGSIHPDAVVLDVDELYPFYNGAAIVRKGSATALINAKGEFIVPFNKYKFDTNSKNGFFIVTSYDKINASVGFITSKGDYINTKGYPAIWEEYLIDSENITGSNGGPIHYIYTITSEKYKITGDIPAIDTRIGNELIPFGTTGKVGFKNFEDKIVIKPIYLSVDPFYEGVAIVSKQNEFGEIKYIYIDTNGNPITSIQFSRKPEPFSNGLGKVYYSFNERLKYSYINKKGEIIFTENNKDQFGAFYLGYAQKIILGTSKSFIIDKNMKQKTVSEFLNDFGIEPKNDSGSITFPKETSNINTSSNFPFLPFRFYNGQKVQYGYLFIESKSAVYGDFEDTDFVNEFIFDKVSGLKHIKWKKSKMSGDVIDGYINTEGVFMIVKGEASKW